MQSVSDLELSTPLLGSTVLYPDGLRRLPISLKVVSKDLLEEYGEPSDTSVVDFFDFVAHEILCLIAQGDHHFTHFPLKYLESDYEIDDS